MSKWTRATHDGTVTRKQVVRRPRKRQKYNAKEAAAQKRVRMRAQLINSWKPVK